MEDTRKECNTMTTIAIVFYLIVVPAYAYFLPATEEITP